MADYPIEQALYLRRDRQTPEAVARSPGFREAWAPDVEALLVGFGDRPPGGRCPSAVFAQPLGATHVAVVHAADRDPDGAGYPTALGFHLLIIPRRAYTRFLGDPFFLSEKFPPSWDIRGELPSLSWPPVPPPPRTVEQVRAVLRRVKSHALAEDEDVTEAARPEPTAENSESPALLGGVQALVDGGRLVFERPAPDARLMQGLWALLPSSTRAELWPASFAFGNALGFDALIVPHADPEVYQGYYTEEQAADYPQGRYELGLQVAAESGDQAELDALFGRRSWNDTWRLGITLLVMVAVLALAGRWLQSPVVQDGPRQLTAEERRDMAKVAAGVVGIRDPLHTLTVLPHARGSGTASRE